MFTFSVSYRWKCRVNTSQSRRERIGDWLRKLATRIDRRFSLAIAIEATPAISRHDEINCIRFGIDKMLWAVNATVEAQAEEVLLTAMTKEKHGTPT